MLHFEALSLRLYDAVLHLFCAKSEHVLGVGRSQFV
jgi:hypothetical protein